MARPRCSPNINVSDSFYVSGNGMNYGSFAYGQTFYTIGAFAGDGSSVYELIITDFENNDCSTFIEFGALDCPIGDCFIDDIEVFDFYCDTDSTYSMVFNAEISDPGNEFIDVWVNNEFWAFYEISALPITISGITPRESDYDIIQICVNDNELCCAAIEYMAPDCLVDHIQEVEEGFSIYPNPVSETLFIQSDSSLINPRVVIYDSVGKEVLVHSGITSPLSVSMLASGVYQLAIFEGEKRVLITEIIKR